MNNSNKKDLGYNLSPAVLQSFDYWEEKVLSQLLSPNV